MSIVDLYIKQIIGEDNIPQPKADYDANGNMVYEGYARQGDATSDRVWTIFKHSYDANHQWTGSQCVRNAIWDNRASIF